MVGLSIFLHLGARTFDNVIYLAATQEKSA